MGGENPAAAKLFAIMKLPLADINAQNAMMHAGKSSEADVQGHVDGWINAHQQQFDGWVKKRWPRRNNIVLCRIAAQFMRRYPAYSISPQTAQFITSPFPFIHKHPL